MADTLTENLLLTDQQEGSNSNSWGQIVDNNWHRLDAILGDTTEITTTGGETVLTTEQELVAAISVDGTLASNVEITFSGRGGFWILDNATTGEFTVTAKVSGGTGTLIEQGTRQVVWCDGDDILAAHTSPDAAPEVTVASASTTDILGAGSEFVAISGTTTITSFGTGVNRKRFCRAAGDFTLTHHATSLILPGGENVAVKTGDTFIVVSDASSNARVVSYLRATGRPVVIPPTPDLDAIEALTGTGILRRVGDGEWSLGTTVVHLGDTTANRLFGTDGDGKSGLITLSGLALSGGQLTFNIGALTEDTNPDSDSDYVATHDASAGAAKKVLLGRIPGALLGILEDRKSQGTDGGTFLSGDWRTRVLNTEVYDRLGIISLSSNRFTISQAGSYEIQWTAPAMGSGGGWEHQSRLFNVTGSAVVAYGESCRVPGTSDNQADKPDSAGHAVVTLAGSTTFEIQHRVSANRSFGSAANFGTEVYSRVIIRRA